MQIREVVRKLQPYVWEPSNEQIALSVGLKPGEIVRFDTNVSPNPPSSLLIKLASQLNEMRVNEYPDTSYTKLRRAISNYAEVTMDQIVVTCGADEALDMAAKTFIDHGSFAVTSSPTYALFKIVTELMGGNVKPVPRLEDFEDDVEGLLKAASTESRVIFLCSPNNPTGNISRRETVVSLLSEAGCAVVVDEAYYEFSGRTVVDLTKKYDNLVVVRTFSKAFSLAGARVGYMISSPETAGMLNKVRPPNSVSVISLLLSEAALNDLELMRRNVELIVRERDRCIKFLEECSGVKVYPSHANFVLLRFEKGGAERVYSRLLKKGLVVRCLSGTPGLEGCLRFNVNLPEKNDLLLEALATECG
mgnify:CR=1 FL=1